MIKVLGALMIVGGTTAWGIGSVLKMKNRVLTIRSLIAALDMIRDEICINLTPLMRVMEMAAGTVPAPAADFFRAVSCKSGNMAQQGFYGIWMDALNESRTMTIGEEERDVLIRLGSGLGKYDSESQGRVIATAKKNLERIESRTEKERAANSKLHAFLGVAAGMMAVVVLI